MEMSVIEELLLPDVEQRDGVLPLPPRPRQHGLLQPGQRQDVPGLGPRVRQRVQHLAHQLPLPRHQHPRQRPGLGLVKLHQTLALENF